MRAEMIAELGGSVIITAITGLYSGGLALAGYSLLALHSSPNALGMISLLFGIVNLPVFIIWIRETVREISLSADSTTSEQVRNCPTMLLVDLLGRRSLHFRSPIKRSSYSVRAY